MKNSQVANLSKTLIDLYAEQEEVIITCKEEIHNA